MIFPMNHSCDEEKNLTGIIESEAYFASIDRSWGDLSTNGFCILNQPLFGAKTLYIPKSSVFSNPGIKLLVFHNLVSAGSPLSAAFTTLQYN